MRPRIFRILFLLVFLIYTCSVIGQGQTFDGCLSHKQLCELCGNNVNDMSQIMGRQRFFLVSSDNNVPFIWNKDTLKLSLYNWQFAQGFNEIYVNAFYKEGFHNFVEYNTSTACTNKLLQECKVLYMDQYADDNEDSTSHTSFTDNSSKETTNPALTFDFKEGYRFIFPEEKNGDDHYLILIYDPIDFKQLTNINKSQQEQQLIDRQIKEQAILRNMNAADSLALLEEYPAAIQLLEEVYDLLPDYMRTVDDKLGTINNQYKEKKIRTYTEEAERLYKDGNYQGALEMYAKVLKEDINNKNATERTANINRKLDILHQRGQITYDYKESNPENCIEFRKALEAELNNLVYNTNDGHLKMDFSILFDTLGTNLSYYNIIEFNTIAINKNHPIFQSHMSNLLGHKALQPSYNEEIPIRSATTFNINLNWDSHKMLFVKNRKKIICKSPYVLSTNPIIESTLLNDPKMYYGKYHFNVKQKTCNGQQYSDIQLTKYKTVGGEAFIYGLFPGLGTLIATQGKEGAACMTLSLLFYGGAIASYVLYKDYKKQYDETPSTLEEKDAKSLNTKKEVCKWAAITGVSVGGTIHLSGMIKAMVRGIQNKKASKELRQALENGPLEIQEEDINIQ